MRLDRTASANGDGSSHAGAFDSRAKPEDLQAKCRHQAVVIDTLSEAVSTFHRGANAPKAENSELRTDNDRLRGWRALSARASGRLDDARSPLVGADDSQQFATGAA